MADPHVISALREERALIAGLIRKLECKPKPAMFFVERLEAIAFKSLQLRDV